MNILLFFINKLGLLLKGPDLFLSIGDSITGYNKKNNTIQGLYSELYFLCIFFIFIIKDNNMVHLSLMVYIVFSVLLLYIYRNVHNFRIKNRKKLWRTKIIAFPMFSFWLPLGFLLVMLSIAFGGVNAIYFLLFFIWFIIGLIISSLNLYLILFYKFLTKKFHILNNKYITKGILNSKNIIYTFGGFLLTIYYIVISISFS